VNAIYSNRLFGRLFRAADALLSGYRLAGQDALVAFQAVDVYQPHHLAE